MQKKLGVDMKKRSYLVLTVLNYLQTVPAFLLIPFILFGGYGASPDRPYDNFGITDYVGIYIFLILLASVPTFYLSFRTGNILNKGIPVSDRIRRPFTIIHIVISIANCIVAYLFGGASTLLILGFVSVFSFASFNINQTLISTLKKIDLYYVAPPVWFMVIPVVTFLIFGFIIGSLPEKYNFLIILDLIFCGILLFGSVNFTTSCTMNTKEKCITYENPKLIGYETEYLYFSKIKRVKRTKFFYIVESSEPSCKILKFSTNIKTFKKDLQEYGIEFVQ